MADIGIIKFQLASLQFGMFADRILEIVRVTDVRAIPRPLPYVVGFTEIRNYVVVIVDLRRRLGLPPVPLIKGATMIVANMSSGMLGLLVDSISHFKRISQEELLSPIPIAGFPAHLLSGVLAENDDMIIVPDFDRIFSSYIRIQVLPITPSEKIAFQYRSTPGAITRTLETMIVTRQFLDEKIIKKLSRSISLAAVHVHKITSYYPNFHPKKSRTEIQKPDVLESPKAGDASYSSLSRQLELQYQRKQREEYVHKEGNAEFRKHPSPFTKKYLDTLWEGLLASTGVTGEELFPEIPVPSPEVMISHPEVGGDIARTLRISAVRLRKYFTYYAQQTAKKPPDPLAVIRKQPSQATIQTLDDHLEEFKRSHLELQNVLQWLCDKQYTLKRRHINWLTKHYHISPVKLAALLSLFPKLSFDLTPETEEVSSSEETFRSQEVQHEEEEQEQPQADDTMYHLQQFKIPSSADAIRQCLQRLSEEGLLQENSAIRYAAMQLRVSTCRLSKLRSYYDMKLDSHQ